MSGTPISMFYNKNLKTDQINLKENDQKLNLGPIQPKFLAFWAIQGTLYTIYIFIHIMSKTPITMFWNKNLKSDQTVFD